MADYSNKWLASVAPGAEFFDLEQKLVIRTRHISGSFDLVMHKCDEDDCTDNGRTSRWNLYVYWKGS